ncbi:MAG: FAD-binding protein [Ilumatobacteraceae bacterium]
MKPSLHSTVLSGWGLTSPSRANLGSATATELTSWLTDFDSRGVIVRGLGRSYGDPASNAGGAVVTLESSLLDIALDRSTGTLRAGGGVSLHDLLEIVLPQGFFVPVTPGTRYVTVGGAIASDIHGKNHHLEGSFGNHLLEIELLLADGTVRSVGPDVEPDLFWATVGGMGLTGIILSARFRLLKVETSRCLVSTRRCDDIDELMSAMTEDDDKFRYSVAWTDLQATGRALGRSVLWRGDHASLSDLNATDRTDPFRYDPQHLITVPPLVPGPGFVNSLTSRVFCEAWFRRAPRQRDGEIKSIPAFFHPLDAIGRWNRLYGRQGFVQYQFVVPFASGDTVRRIVERVSASRLASPLVVLKRFGASNDGHLSFPMPGWTLTVDLPAGHRELPELLRELDALVLDSGGRHYLAKDAHMSPDAVRRGYPRLAEWKTVQRRVDPTGLWQSDLARRLHLLEGTVE